MLLQDGTVHRKLFSLPQNTQNQLIYGQLVAFLQNYLEG